MCFGDDGYHRARFAMSLSADILPMAWPIIIPRASIPSATTMMAKMMSPLLTASLLCFPLMTPGARIRALHPHVRSRRVRVESHVVGGVLPRLQGLRVELKVVPPSARPVRDDHVVGLEVASVLRLGAVNAGADRVLL